MAGPLRTMLSASRCKTGKSGVPQALRVVYRTVPSLLRASRGEQPARFEHSLLPPSGTTGWQSRIRDCAALRKVCYGRCAMYLRIAITLGVARRATGYLPQHLVFVVLAVAVCATLLGCNRTTVVTPSTDYSATVEALLPTAEPMVPPTPTPAATSDPSIDTPAPTFTPRPRPTYTPWPTPTKATTEDRQPAIPFNAQMLDGTEFSLPDSYGSPTLLAFFAPW